MNPTQPIEQTDFSTVESVIAYLQSRGSRITSPRRFLLEALFSADGHLTVEALTDLVQKPAPSISLSTVYRNLEELEVLGVISHSHLGHGPSTYLLASHAHAHFICDYCGKMIEAPQTMFQGLAEAAHAKLGFSIDPKHFGIVGRCGDCAEANA